MKKLENLNTQLIQFNYKSIINTNRLMTFDLVSEKDRVGNELNTILKHLERINITAFTQKSSTIFELNELKNASVSLNTYKKYLDILDSTLHEIKKISKTLQSLQGHINHFKDFKGFSERISFHLHENNQFILFVHEDFRKINEKKDNKHNAENDNTLLEKKLVNNSWLDKFLNFLFTPKAKVR